jgi:hypothetical protein
MDSDIDKPMLPIIEEFNKSQHIKTVYCCAGHKISKKDKYEVSQVYILFEMDKEHVGPFMELALTSLTKKMVHDCSLHPQIGRCMHGKWPRKNRERIALSFNSNDGTSRLSMKQIKIARKYFMRLAEKTASAL